MAVETGALTAYRARQNTIAKGHRTTSAALNMFGAFNSVAGGVNALMGNWGLSALNHLAATALYSSANSRKATAMRYESKGKAVEALIMRGRDAKLARGRAALQRAAAVRAVAEMRSTSLASRVARIRSGAKASSNGLVTSYTRVQGGRAIRVQGYSRR